MYYYHPLIQYAYDTFYDHVFHIHQFLIIVQQLGHFLVSTEQAFSKTISGKVFNFSYKSLVGNVIDGFLRKIRFLFQYENFMMTFC